METYPAVTSMIEEKKYTYFNIKVECLGKSSIIHI
jgi:hypothetical protein